MNWWTWLGYNSLAEVPHQIVTMVNLIVKNDSVTEERLGWLLSFAYGRYCSEYGRQYRNEPSAIKEAPPESRKKNPDDMTEEEALRFIQEGDLQTWLEAHPEVKKQNNL